MCQFSQYVLTGVRSVSMAVRRSFHLLRMCLLMIMMLIYMPQAMAVVGVDWERINQPAVGDLVSGPQGVAWAGGQFVLLANQGGLFTSPNGTVWTSQVIGATAPLYSIAWSGSQYVVLGAHGEIFTSLDGVTWTPQTSGTTESLESVAWGGSQFVAVGAGGTILTSPDGITWTPRASGTTSRLTKVIHGSHVPIFGPILPSGEFVAVGYDNTILTSADGVIWTLTILPQYILQFTAVVKASLASSYVALTALGDVYTSPDASVWTRQTVTGLVSVQSVTWDNTQYVAVNSSGGIATSPGAITWTPQISGTTESLRSVAWNGSQLVAVGGSSTVLISSDGVAWVPAREQDILSVIWDNNGQVNPAGGSQFVAVGRRGMIRTSVDGVVWTDQVSGIALDINAVADGLGQLVAVGASGTILTSPDGITWTVQTSGISQDLYDVEWNGLSFVAVGQAGTMLFSVDNGVTWVSVVSGTSNNLNALTTTMGDGFVVAGDGGTILTGSSLTWTAQSSGTINSFNSIVWSGIGQAGPGALVAVGASATATSDSSGVTWAAQPSFYLLNSVAWGDTQYATVGNNGVILTSPDAVAWTEQISGTFEGLNGVAWNGSAFVAVGNGGTILRSAVATPPAPVGIRIGVNRSAVVTGDVLNVLVETTAGTTPTTQADIYVTLQLPDGTQLIMQPGLTSFSTTLTPVLSNVAVPTFRGQIFSHTFTGAEPVGRYKWKAALMVPGTLTPIGTIKQTTFIFVP